MIKKIFVDTNILISAIIFDKKELELLIRCVSENIDIYISEHVLEEATRVFMKKFPEYLQLFEKFITLSEIEIIKRKIYGDSIKNIKNIRDKYDAHIIACAKASNCKIIISGDKDLLSYKNKKIKIMKTSDFLQELN